MSDFARKAARDAGIDPDDAPTVSYDARRISDVEPEEVGWLWPDRLPVGKIVMLDGDPGLGKSVITLDLAARLSRGDSFPFQTGLRDPMNSLILTAEDGIADTVRPRCEAAEADMDRVTVLRSIKMTNQNGKSVSRRPRFPEDYLILQNVITDLDVGLVVVDVLSAYVEKGYRMNDDQDIRQVLGPLAEVAEQTQCCIVALRHLNKGAGLAAMYRGSGSIAVTGAARVSLIVGPNPDDQSIEDVNERRKVLAVNKANLSKMGRSLDYRTIDRDGIVAIQWGGYNSFKADDLVGLGADLDPDDAAGFLRLLLADGEMYAEEVYKAGKDAGFSRDQIKRAKKRAGVKTDKQVGVIDGRWFWALRDHKP